MVNISIKCVSEELRNALLKELNGKGNSSVKVLMDKIRKAPECGAKGTRKRSAYNDFVSSCMKEIGKSVPVTERMKTCAVRWNSKKK